MTSITSATSFNVTATFSYGDSTIATLSAADPPASLAETKALQLHALLEQCYGEGFQSFNNSADCIKENLLWLAASMAKEICVLCDLAARVHHD